MARLGTPPLQPGDELRVGDQALEEPATDLAPVAPMSRSTIELPLLLGPRDDWFTDEAIDRLARHDFTVTSGHRSRGRPAGRAGAAPAAVRRAGQ